MENASTKIIMLIEDNVDFAEIVKEFIEENTSLQVMHATTGRLALECLQQISHRVIGIFSDIMMVDMDGIDFLAHLRKSPEFGYIPLILLSGADPLVFESLLRPYPYSAFVPKPVDMGALLDAIDRHFGHVGRRQLRAA